ncbi:DeoR/GlpR family DNA-binding transcription regulator [Glaciihabitans sp. UYNi722]|uniref:DeoR/GlpR family DNA-binding transcription regulator n=1 Tax=Glaciihabitans sp. UYNi722 TaxID=3156344 RepID=UPI0033915549
MIAAQRRNLILDSLRADGAVSITSLAAVLESSAVTIRRDLDYLDSVGKLTRTHGGAVAGESPVESPYAEKIVQAIPEKEAIGRLAASLVHDGEVLIIWPGTTTEALAKQLRQRTGLTIITNSLPVAQAFVDSPGNQVIMTGGTLRASILALVGDAKNRTLRGIHADTTFLSGNGLVADFGLSTPNMAVADADRAMAASGNQVVVLADHTKLGLRTAIQTLPTDSISQLVTDAGSPAHEIESLSHKGVTVHIATIASGLSDTF